MKTNLELVKSLYLGDAEQNGKNLQAILAPEFEWTESAGFPYTGKFHTFEEVANGLFVPLTTEWIGFRAEVQSFYDAGDTIIAMGFYRATYKKTHRAMEALFAHFWTLKNGRVVKYVQCADTKKVWEAFGDAGAS